MGHQKNLAPFCSGPPLQIAPARPRYDSEENSYLCFRANSKKEVYTNMDICRSAGKRCLVCIGAWFVTSILLHAQQSPISFLDSNLNGTQISGTTEQAIVELSHELAQKSITVGFGRISAGPSVYLSLKGGSVREVLSELCAQDQRYQMLSIEAEQVVEIVPRQSDPVKTLLQLRISRVDLGVNDWPDNLIRYLPDYIPELGQYLAGYYAGRSRLTVQPGSPGISMKTDVLPPRYEVHMSNSTIADVLNVICLKSRTLVSEDKRARRPIAQVISGWKVTLPSPDREPLIVWQKNIFSTLP